MRLIIQKFEIRLSHFPKIAVEYVKLCGYKNGEIGRNHLQQCQNGTPKLSLDEIASQLGTSKRNLQRALRIERNLTDSMKELLDTDPIRKVVASREDNHLYLLLYYHISH